MAKITICDTAKLKEGESHKFQFERDGVSFEGFVVRLGGDLFAYENRCRHLPLPLDYGDGVFLTPDRKHIVCSSHGAMYEPRSGKCVQGPCAGASLKPLPISILEGSIHVEVEDTDGNPA